MDEKGHGGRGGSGRMDVHLHQDLQKYNFDKKLTYLKIQSGAVTINVRSSVITNCDTTNVI